VFALTRADSLVLKLPEDLRVRLCAECRGTPLVMGKRVMRECFFFRSKGTRIM